MATGSLSNDTAFRIEYGKITPRLKRNELFAESLENRKTIMGVVFKNDVESLTGKLPPPVQKIDNHKKKQIPFATPASYTTNPAILQNTAYSGGFFDNPMLDDDGAFRRVSLLEVDGNNMEVESRLNKLYGKVYHYSVTLQTDRKL